MPTLQPMFCLRTACLMGWPPTTHHAAIYAHPTAHVLSQDAMPDGMVTRHSPCSHEGPTPVLSQNTMPDGMVTGTAIM